MATLCPQPRARGLGHPITIGAASGVNHGDLGVFWEGSSRAMHLPRGASHLHEEECGFFKKNFT